MSERVLCYQNNAFQTGSPAAESENGQPEELQDVAHLQELTPYGLLLASLAFEGNLTAKQRQVLHQVAKAFPTRRMIKTGIQVQSN